MGRVSSYTFSYRTKIVLQHQRSSVEDEANVKRIRKYNRKSQKASFIAIRVLCQSGMEPNKELCERRRRRPPRSSSESHLYALKSNLGRLCSRRKRIDHRWMSFCFTLFFPFSVLSLSLSLFPTRQMKGWRLRREDVMWGAGWGRYQSKHHIKLRSGS